MMIFFIPSSQNKKGKIVNNLIPFRVCGGLHHKYKLKNKLNILQVGLTCCVNTLN